MKIGDHEVRECRNSECQAPLVNGESSWCSACSAAIAQNTVLREQDEMSDVEQMKDKSRREVEAFKRGLARLDKLAGKQIPREHLLAMSPEKLERTLGHVFNGQVGLV